MKGHVGVVENELVDKAAKKEAKCTTQIGPENPRNFPEIAAKDIMVERKEDLWESPKVLRPFAVGIMRRIKSKMGKMIIMGAEQWWGQQIPKIPEEILCDCGLRHDGDFYGIVSSCRHWSAFRKQAEFEWQNRTGVPFSHELLWARIRASTMRSLEALYERRAFKMVGGYLTWWHVTLRTRKKTQPKFTYTKLAKEQEGKMVEEHLIYESGKISEKEVEIEIPEENLRSFRARLKSIEKDTARKVEAKGGNKKEFPRGLKGKGGKGRK